MAHTCPRCLIHPAPARCLHPGPARLNCTAWGEDGRGGRGSSLPLPSPRAVPTARRCCPQGCSVAGHSQLLPAARLPQPHAVIQPLFPAGFAQTSLLSLCLF